MASTQLVFWADKIADKIITERKHDMYTVASGITPSGTIHIGNLREEMTASIVARSLEHLGAKVRYIHSWDDFDRLRKVPGNIDPKIRTKFQDFIGMPVFKVPDPFGCHNSYGYHFEKEFEDTVKDVGIKPEYIYQHKKYTKCEYAEGIKTALQMKEKIKTILSKFKTQKDDGKEYWPCEIYCQNCWKDLTEILSYDGNYGITYNCKACGNESEFDFRKIGIVKLKWRIDWPMRWSFEKVDFEPGGKEHSTPGGSRTTATLISEDVYGYVPPMYQMYDFVLGTGGTGKMSGSVGNTINPKQMLSVYIPEVFRYFYVSTKPVKEFIIPFDDGVNKVYEDFYRCERIYFGSDEMESEVKRSHWKRVYELCSVNKIPTKQPIQVPFSQILQLSEFFDFETMIKKLTESGHKKSELKSSDKRLKSIFEASKYWRTLSEPKATDIDFSEDDREVLRDLLEVLKKDRTEDEWTTLLFDLSKKKSFPKKFFKAVYMALIGKPYGPRLAELINTLGIKESSRRIKIALK